MAKDPFDTETKEIPFFEENLKNLTVTTLGQNKHNYNVTVNLDIDTTLTDNVVTVDMSKDFTHAQAKVTSLNYDGDDFINLINKED
jgi:hypothetical protein